MRNDAADGREEIASRRVEKAGADDWLDTGAAQASDGGCGQRLGPVTPGKRRGQGRRRGAPRRRRNG